MGHLFVESLALSSQWVPQFDVFRILVARYFGALAQYIGSITFIKRLAEYDLTECFNVLFFVNKVELVAEQYCVVFHVEKTYVE
jgi:hypothetical protein